MCGCGGHVCGCGGHVCVDVGGMCADVGGMYACVFVYSFVYSVYVHVYGIQLLLSIRIASITSKRHSTKSLMMFLRRRRQRLPGS